MFLPRTRFGLLATALLAACTAMPAIATTPRPLDCAKAQAIAVGWTGKQVIRTLGKPYVMRFARDSMTYGWQDADGEDRLEVEFDNQQRNLDARQVQRIHGRCGGSAIGQAASTSALAPDAAALAALPRRITFEGTEFHLAYVAESVERRLRFVEYLPQGQTLDAWRTMIAVFLHADGSTPQSQLAQARQAAEQAGNPHFRQVHLSASGDEAAAALPMRRDSAVEYQLPYWRAVPGGVLATVYFSRLYGAQGAGLDRHVQDQEAAIDTHLAALRALPAIVPPAVGSNGALTLTRDGTAHSEVLVDAAAAPATRATH